MFKDRYYWHNPSVEGMRDWWIKTLVDIISHEQIDGVFVDLTVGEPSGDEDGDGITNLEEYQAASSPDSAADLDSGT